MKAKRNDVSLFLLLAMVLLFTSCDKGSKVRKYKEKQPAAAQMPQAKKTTPTPGTFTTPGPGPAHAHFQWDTPEGWQEERKSSGLRLATFTITSQNKESICTIIPLQGEAGGLKANVTRWLSQATGKMADSITVDNLIKNQEKFLTKGQFPAVLIDFTPATPNPTDKSILVTIITIQGNSVFVKMLGEKAHLVQNKEKFKTLCQSFSL
jgi:hypothetical protein